MNGNVFDELRESRRRERGGEEEEVEREKLLVIHKKRNNMRNDARDAFQRALALSFFLAFCSFYAGSRGETNGCFF